MSLHFIASFQPHPSKESAFRDALLQVVGPTRAEAGCLDIRIFECIHEPGFAVHSEWVDEAAFERHIQLPHATRFVEAAKELLTHPIQGIRMLEIRTGADEPRQKIPA